MDKESQEEVAPRKRRRIAKWLLIAAACVVVFFAVLLLSVPYIVTHVPIPDLAFDMSEVLTDMPDGLVTNKKVTASVSIVRGVPDGFRVRVHSNLSVYLSTNIPRSVIHIIFHFLFPSHLDILNFS